MKKNIILSDCDDVLFEWSYPYIDWMTRQGHAMTQPTKHHSTDWFGITPGQDADYVRRFNQGYVSQQQPCKDALEVVSYLKEQGYVFHVITAFGDCPKLKSKRADRLKQVFGDAIWDITVLDYGASKEAALKQYEGSGLIWVEDSYRHYKMGQKLGLDSVLMLNSWNEYQPREDDAVCQKVFSWTELLHRKEL